MNTTTLMTAQLHRNPELMLSLQSRADIRHDSRPVRLRGRRRRRY